MHTSSHVTSPCDIQVKHSWIWAVNHNYILQCRNKHACCSIFQL